LTENGVRRPLNRLETEKHGHGLYRIGVSPTKANLKPWIKLKSLAKLSDRSVYLLETSAKGVGANPFEWWGSLFPIPSKHWLTIEHFKDGAWKEADIHAS